jgi:1-deoxy-D-xylulose-5-phosphate reductoisomerase
MKNIAILGSTGSIGRSALEVIRHFPDEFHVVALSANSNLAVLNTQIKEFHPEFVCVGDVTLLPKIRLTAGRQGKIYCGQAGLLALLQEKKIEEVLVAISGSAALLPLLGAIKQQKQIALANKEALVMAGPLIMRALKDSKARILPVDSEQSAIWQCLEGRKKSELKNIYLTASGGPFRQTAWKELSNVPIKKVLRHPRWKMGKKVTVDSATLMNKGLELLEAMFLFNVASHKIKVLIHPQAIIHSMVEFIDGVVLAQLSATDMRIPIQYALSYPRRLSNSLPALDFYKLKSLDFTPPDFKKFPCLGLAYRAAETLGTMPAVLNATNEVCVEEFLTERLKFALIPMVIQKVMDSHRQNDNPELADILAADSWAREQSRKLINTLN